jgi:hypothetical protein
MKKRFLPKVLSLKLGLVLFIFAGIPQLYAQIVTPIPLSYRGQNLWMPYKIGNEILNGQLEQKKTELEGSGIQIYRFGGKAVEEFITSEHVDDYTAMIDFVRNDVKNQNARFVLQLPFNTDNLDHNDPDGFPYSKDLSGAAKQAYFIVRDVTAYVNTLTPKPEIIWMISNEPDHPEALNTTDPEVIKTYIAAFSAQIKNADPNAKIAGPGLTYFRNWDGLIDALTDQSNPNTNILPYITHFTYHYYPFGHQAKFDPDVPAPTRQNTINILRNPVLRPNSSYSSPLSSDLVYLKNRLSGTDVKIAITEANICYGNDVGEAGFNYRVWNGVENTNNPQDQTNDGLSGNGANSFIAGQFWAEMMAVGIENSGGTNGLDFINFWSTIEGSLSSNDPTERNYKTNIGFIDPRNGKKKSTYHHMWLMEKIKGDYHTSKIFETGHIHLPGGGMTSIPYTANNIKSFASSDGSKIYVMIMNQNLSGFQPFGVFLWDAHIGYDINNPLPHPEPWTAHFGELHITFPSIKIQKGFRGYIEAQSTKLIEFDANGNFIKWYDYKLNNHANCDYSPSTHTWAPPMPTNPWAVNYSACPPSGIVKPKDDEVRVCPDPSNPAHLKGNIGGSQEIKDRVLHISGDVVIPRNSELVIRNAEVVLRENSSIRVQPGGRLEIIDSRVTGCNEAKWGGIIINGDVNNITSITLKNNLISGADKVVSAERTNNIEITGNVFSAGKEALNFNRSSNFKIENNYFFGFEKVIKTAFSPRGNSTISQNYFGDGKSHIEFSNDNHSNLSISCNLFENYSEYAIYSNNTNLKDQGTNDFGAGNSFVSNSTFTNNQLRHTGNRMRYYYDPNSNLNLVTEGGMSAIAISASNNGDCFGAAPTLSQASSSNEVETAPENIHTTSTHIRTQGKIVLLEAVPNPATGKVTIHFNTENQKPSKAILINLYGQVIEQQNITGSAGSVEFDITSYPSGMYYYGIISDGEIVTVKKLIITK